MFDVNPLLADVNPLPHIKYQALLSLKNNEKIFKNVVCCSATAVKYSEILLKMV